MEKQKFKLIIFDLDGTLVDTSEGIYDCFNFALKSFGVPEPYNFDGVIGGPLFDNFKNHFGLSESDAKQAVYVYRQRYAEVGIIKSKLYDGMAETLSTLKANGFKLAVATLKAERLAVPLLEKLDVAKFFDVIHGVDDNDKLTKADLINLCLNELNVKSSDTVLVGDSKHDAVGADGAGVAFLPVTYGFGFKDEKDLTNINHIFIANSANDLIKYFDN